jgi:hypothetical protein
MSFNQSRIVRLFELVTAEKQIKQIYNTNGDKDMIDWKKIVGDVTKVSEEGREYLVTDGKAVTTAHYTTPYEDKNKIVWYSYSSQSYVDMKISHFAEYNLPEESQTYTVKIELEVTADSKEEALKHTISDINELYHNGTLDADITIS